MKKIIFFLIISISFLQGLNSQTIEKLFETNEVVHKTLLTNESPFGICVDEKNNIIEIMNGNWDGSTCFLISDEIKEESKDDYISFWTNCNIRFGNITIGFSDSIITIQENKNIHTKIKNIKSGISFILKKDKEYIVYYVNEYGIPGAVDSTGKIYGNREAIEYLREYDPEKYNHSLRRAKELELDSLFADDEVLIWGDTVFSPSNGLIQYDDQGNYYYCEFLGNLDNYIECYHDKDNVFSLHNIQTGSSIIGHGEHWSTSWYIGFGGNIYYYVAGEEYTEVFRIRRTWGLPDMYALAINGYTTDQYGDYVDNILPKMTKADLRLLRNTIFALYGCHFNSKDLAEHFNREVWYTDQGKTSSQIQLPEHRQHLLEKIQELEKQK